MKKIIYSTLIGVLVISFLMPISGAESRVKAYHSGSAVSYNGYIVVSTTNSGQLEVFKLREGGDLTKFVGFKSYDQRFGTERDFYDSMLRVEGGRLYVYAVDGRSLNKYDISDLKKSNFVKRVEDASWDWFAGLATISGRVSTVGSRGVKLWNSDLAVVDSYDLVNKGDNTYNITPAESEKFLFNVTGGKIVIFDRDSRKKLKEVPLTFNWGSNWFKRSIYNDRVDNAVYVVDDSAVRKINFDGEIIKSFRHTGTIGYDVVPSADGGYIYFSDGIGIVKLRKSDLKVIAYEYTTDLGAGGGWAMGLRAVNTPDGERLVLFNTTSIIVLDSNLKPVKSSTGRSSFVLATVEDPFPEISEPLSLSVDRTHAAVNSKIIVHGTGFGKNEALMIQFGGVDFPAEAGFDGRFSQEVTVPNYPAGPTDIKVSGMSTGFHYSVGFRIE